MVFFLPFEVLYLKDHFRGDGSFVIEHGVCERLLSYGANLSWDAEADLMDGFEGLVMYDGLLGARQFEVMCHIVFALIGTEAGHVITHGDSLVEGLHNGELHDSSEVGLA